MRARACAEGKQRTEWVLAAAHRACPGGSSGGGVVTSPRGCCVRGSLADPRKTAPGAHLFLLGLGGVGRAAVAVPEQVDGGIGPQACRRQQVSQLGKAQHAGDAIQSPAEPQLQLFRSAQALLRHLSVRISVGGCDRSLRGV